MPEWEYYAEGHSPTKEVAAPKNQTPKVAKAVLEKLAEINHPVTSKVLTDSLVKQATLKDQPVLLFPMHTGSYHCINYTTYPEEPRFLNAPPSEGKPCKLGLLNKPVNPEDGDFTVKPTRAEGWYENSVF